MERNPGHTKSCAFCDGATVANCNSCNKCLCVNHDIYDDPYHTGGLFYQKKHWCKQCHDTRQGTTVSIVIFLAIVLLCAIIAVFILV